MDFQTLLEDALKDESEGIEHYEKLAELASEKHAPIIRDILKEERQHLRFLKEIAGETIWACNESDANQGSENEPVEEQNKADDSVHEASNSAPKETDSKPMSLK